MRDQRADWLLISLEAMIEIPEEAPDDEVGQQTSHGETDQKVNDALSGDVAALVVSVRVRVRIVSLVAHAFSGTAG